MYLSYIFISHITSVEQILDSGTGDERSKEFLGEKKGAKKKASCTVKYTIYRIFDMRPDNKEL